MSKAAKLNECISLPSDQDASGRTLGDAELERLAQAIRSGTLTVTKGRHAKELERRFAELLGLPHAYACASGTAAIHSAIAAVDPEPGDEIVTTAITDMGAIAPILYQGAIPVFADIDPRTWNVTAQSVEAALSDRTRAILVTHLFGNPCPMQPIMELARRRGIPVIEDSAQAFLAQHRGRTVGAIGDIGCFSLQQGKHITTGEGGLVVTNCPDLGRRMFLFINKAWGYGDAHPDHYFLALNYRMSELQGAVAAAQLDSLEEVVSRRIWLADMLTERLQDVPGVAPPYVAEGDTHSYWKYCLRVEAGVIPGGPAALGALLKQRGIASAPRYIQKPAFQCQVIAEQKTFGKSRFPFTLARPEAVDYRPERFPGTFQGLAQVLVLPWNERYEDRHIDHLEQSIKESAAELRKGA